MTTSDGSTRNLADTNAQPAPERNDKPAVWSLVMRDMTERDIFGAEKYGTRLQPGNGRDFLLDAYQEALDLVVYLRGAIYERDEMATVKESLTVHPVHPATFDHIDPADVDIGEQPVKCKGCFAGCRDCCPSLAKIADEKLARMRAASAVRFVNECVGFLSEPASAIDDSSEHYGAPDWSKAPDNAVLYIDWTGSAERFKSSFYSLGGDRFYRLDGDFPTNLYVMRLDSGLPDIDYPYYMRPAN